MQESETEDSPSSVVNYCFEITSKTIIVQNVEGYVKATIDLDLSSSDADSDDFNTSSEPESEAQEEDYDDNGEME